MRIGRSAFVIAESDLNDVRVLLARGRRRPRHGRAVERRLPPRAATRLVTGERRGYFADFGRIADLGKALSDGFVYDGRYSEHRERRHGSSSRDVPGEQLVVFIQNHDQIANALPGPAPRAARRRRSAEAGRDRGAALRAQPAAAVHGRGVRRRDAVPLLRQPHAPAADRRGPCRPPLASTRRSATTPAGPTRRTSARSRTASSTGAASSARRTRSCSRSIATCTRCAGAAPRSRAGTRSSCA